MIIVTWLFLCVPMGKEVPYLYEVYNDSYPWKHLAGLVEIHCARRSYYCRGIIIMLSRKFEIA